MLKKLSILLVSVFILASGAAAFAMNKTDKTGDRESIILGGRVTSIKDNVVTIKDKKGAEHIFEVGSTAGLKVGVSATCEEDCGRKLKLGAKVVNVQKVIKR